MFKWLARHNGSLGLTTVTSHVSQCAWWQGSYPHGAHILCLNKLSCLSQSSRTTSTTGTIAKQSTSSYWIAHFKRKHYNTHMLYVRALHNSAKQWDHNEEISRANIYNGEQDQNEMAIKGSRKIFKEIPVLPFILDRIVEMGVGIQPRRKKKLSSTSTSSRKKGQPEFMSKSEERLYLSEQASRLKGGFTTSKGTSTNQKTTNDTKKKGINLSCVPPPPFAPSYSKVTTHLVKTKNSTKSQLPKTLRVKTTTIRRPVKVLKSVASLSDELPKLTKNLPEVALAGRSNVGKSTLLNALLYGNQFDIHGTTTEHLKRREKEAVKLPRGVKAITSSKPGETKDITFYQLSCQIVEEKTFIIDNNVSSPAVTSQRTKKGQGNNNRKSIDESKSSESTTEPTIVKHSVGLILADLPGYGFAYASEERTKQWGDLMRSYLISRSGLKRMLLLIDARHGFKDADYNFLKSLEPNVPMIQIVLTKCDLVSQDDLARRVVQVQQQLSDALRREPGILPVMLVSAKAGIGYNNIQGDRAFGGILELQRDLASLAPDSRRTR